MPALVAGIHVLHFRRHQDVDGRDEPGHDEVSRHQGRYPRLPRPRGRPRAAAHHPTTVIETMLREHAEAIAAFERSAAACLEIY
jgi:hypothetical protein